MTSNLGQQELRELRKSNEESENRQKNTEKSLIENSENREKLEKLRNSELLGRSDSDSRNGSSSGNSGSDSGIGSRSGPRSGSGVGAEMRIGEDEVDQALMLRDSSYEKMKNDIENDYKNNQNDRNNNISNNNNNNNNDSNNGQNDQSNDGNKGYLTEKREEVINDLTLDLVNKFFSLEFVNRIDEVIMFNPLSIESVQSICKVQISKVKLLLTARGKNVKIKKNCSAVILN